MDKHDPKLLEAIALAQNILKTSGKKLHHNVASSVNNFLRSASNGQTRKKLKEKDLEKIVNIAKSIK